MTDLRNNGFNDSAPIVSDEIRLADTGLGEQHVLNDNGGLSGFHHFEEAEEGGNKGKLIGGALVVALLLGAAGIYAYTGSGPALTASKAPASSMASNAPAPIQTAPVAAPTAAPTADASSVTAKSPYDAAPVASAPVGDTAKTTADVKADKPVKSARAPVMKDHVMKDEATQNTAESEQTAQLNKDSSAADRATKTGSVAVPLPTPPAPPASSVASNGQLVTPEAGSTVQDIPAAPAVTPEQEPAATPAAPQLDQAVQPQVQPQ